MSSRTRISVSEGLCVTNNNWGDCLISLDLKNSKEITEIKNQMNCLGSLLGFIFQEDPTILEKYSNIKKSWEEYQFFRDLTINDKTESTL